MRQRPDCPDRLRRKPFLRTRGQRDHLSRPWQAPRSVQRCHDFRV